MWAYNKRIPFFLISVLFNSYSKFYDDISTNFGVGVKTFKIQINGNSFRWHIKFTSVLSINYYINTQLLQTVLRLVSNNEQETESHHKNPIVLNVFKLLFKKTHTTHCTYSRVKKIILHSIYYSVLPITLHTHFCSSHLVFDFTSLLTRKKNLNETDKKQAKPQTL